MYKTLNEIVDDAYSKLDADEIAFLKEYPRDQLLSVHNWYGRYLRNEYSLWAEDNPLTMLDYVSEMKEGVDCCPRHPDQMSMTILERIWERIQLLQ